MKTDGSQFCSIFVVYFWLSWFYGKKESVGLCVYTSPSSCCSVPSFPSLWGSGARRDCVLGSHPSDLSIFPSLPTTLPASFAWKWISQLLAFGRRTLPSYGKVFNTNLMVCLATVHSQPPPPSVPTGTECGNITFNHPFSNAPQFSFQHVRCFSNEVLPQLPLNPVKGNCYCKLKWCFLMYLDYFLACHILRNRKIDDCKLWYWRRLLRVPWTARRSNQSLLKEINSECSLEGLMVKLKLWYIGYLMWRADSL